MINTVRKTIVSSLAILALASALSAPTAAQAKPGFPGWGPAAIVGGVLLGAALAASAANAANQPYCGRVRQRVYSEDGYVIGWRWVSAC